VAVGRGATAGAAATATGFARALLGGDASAAANHFASDAQLLTPDGTQIGGRPSIYRLLGQLTDSEPELEIKAGRTVVAGDIALCTQYWKRSSRIAAGEPYEAAHVARLVLARREERWQIVIASPWT
jgi:ketosteroid isomerase-like protein